MAGKKNFATVMKDGSKLYEGMLTIQDTKKLYVWNPLYCQLIKDGEYLYFFGHKKYPPRGKPIEFTNIIRCTTDICPPGHATPRPSEKDTYICIQSPERLIFIKTGKRQEREEVAKHIRSALNLPTARTERLLPSRPAATRPLISAELHNRQERDELSEQRTLRPAATRPLISAELHKRKFDSEKFEEVELEFRQDTQVIYYAFFNDKAYVVRATEANEVCAIHPGDQILTVNGNKVNPQSPIAKSIYESVEGTYTLTVKRAPFGTMVYVCLEPTQNISSLGIVWDNTEIHEIKQDGLIVKNGSLSGPMYEDPYGFEKYNWALTEINGKMVPFRSSADKVEEMLQNAGRHLALLFQPADFIDKLSTNERLIFDCSPY